MLSSLPEDRMLDLEFRSLSHSVALDRKKGTKKILHDIYGRFRPGTLSAIIGPSGAGKTALLNVLAGYKTANVKGEVLVNGNVRDLNTFRKQSSYIMQDDYVLGNLTVLETLQFAAELKCGSRSSPEERRDLVIDVIDTLSMSTCSNTRASSLSGGERKRLCIAVELINNPPILFFDEPTSGLDSQTCFQLLSLLSALAAAGRTVICTIHQPSMKILELFQHLVVLADGRCIYRGGVPQLISYMAQKGLCCPPYHNPADFIMETLLGADKGLLDRLVMGVNNGKSEEWDSVLVQGAQTPSFTANQKSQSAYKISFEEKTQDTPQGEDVSWQLDREKDEFQPGSGSYFKQLRILSRRAFLLIIRDKILLWTRLGAHVFIGIVLGLMFQGIGNNAERAYNNAACLYFNHVVLIFAAMMATVLTIPMELPVIVREHMNCWYSVKMYFLTQTLIDVPFQVFFTIIYQCITYFLTGQPPVFESFALVSLLAIVLSIAAQSVGVAVGASIDPQTAVFIGPILTVPMLLFCGFLISIKNMPTYMQWIPYITYLKYAYEGTMAIIYQKGRGDLDCEQPYCHFKSPEVFMEELDLTEAVYWPNLAILTLFAVVIRIIAFFAVQHRIRTSR